jgi:hypothetical protein
MLSPQQQKAKDMKFIFFLNYKPYSEGPFMKYIWAIAILSSILMFLVNVVALILSYINFIEYPILLYDFIQMVNLFNLSYQVTLWFFAVVGAFAKHFNTCYYSMFFLNVSVILETILAITFIIEVNMGSFYKRRVDNGTYVVVVVMLVLIYYFLFFISSFIFYCLTKDLGEKDTENLGLLVHPVPVNLVQNISTYAQPTGAYIPPNPSAVVGNNNSNNIYNPTASQPLYSGVITQQQVHLDINEPNFYPSLNTPMNTPYSSKIVLAHPDDLVFAQNSQNAVINDAVLPSGIRVPSGVDGKAWRVVGNEIMLI